MKRIIPALFFVWTAFMGGCAVTLAQIQPDTSITAPAGTTAMPSGFSYRSKLINGKKTYYGYDAQANKYYLFYTGQQINQLLSNITAGVNSFNGRQGAVTPLGTDYASFYPSLTGSYNNPTWINQLAFSKITGLPNTLGGYGITDAYTQAQVNSLLLGKQNTLTFDAAPTSGSNNPVTSNGIYNALMNLDTGVVHKQGTEYIPGMKVFTGNLYAYDGTNSMLLQGAGINFSGGSASIVAANDGNLQFSGNSIKSNGAFQISGYTTSGSNVISKLQPSTTTGASGTYNLILPNKNDTIAVKGDLLGLGSKYVTLNTFQSITNTKRFTATGSPNTYMDVSNGGINLYDGAYPTQNIANVTTNYINIQNGTGYPNFTYAQLTPTGLEFRNGPSGADIRTTIVPTTGVAAGTYTLTAPAKTGTLATLSDITAATSGYVPATRTISTGYGLSGGGDLSANRTFSADTSLLAPKAYVNNFLTKANAGATYVPQTRTVAGFPLSANVTLGNHAVGYGLLGTTYNGSANVSDWRTDTTVVKSKAGSLADYNILAARINLKHSKAISANPGVAIRSIATADSTNLALWLLQGQINLKANSVDTSLFARRSGPNVFNGTNQFSFLQTAGKNPASSVSRFGAGNSSTIYQYLSSQGGYVTIDPTIGAASGSVYGLYVNPTYLSQGGGVTSLGSFTNPTGVTNGTYVVSPTTSGSGQDVQLNVVVSGNTISGTPTIVNQGRLYAIADNLIFQLPLVAGGTTTVTIPVAALLGTFLQNALGVNGSANITGSVTAANGRFTSTVSTPSLTSQSNQNITLGNSIGSLNISTNGIQDFVFGSIVSNGGRVAVTGTTTGFSGISAGVAITSNQRPGVNNDKVYGLFINSTNENGSSAVQTWSTSTTGTATVSNTSLVTFTATSGSGVGLKLLVATTLGSSTISFPGGSEQRGTLFAVGNTATGSINGVSITITVTAIGLTGITNGAASINGDINLNYTVPTSTDLTKVLVKNTATSNISAVDFTNYVRIVIPNVTSNVTIPTLGATSDYNYQPTSTSSRIVFLLPVNCTAGARIFITGVGSAGWEIDQNAGDVIRTSGGSTTTGTAGKIQSSVYNNCIEIVCNTSNSTGGNTYTVQSFTGSPTFN